MPPPVTLVFRTQRIHLPVGHHEIGRSEACLIILDDPYVSRRHAQVQVGDQEVRVVDLGSRAGTRINGAPLSRPHQVAAGDVLEIGSQTFQFVDSREVGKVVRKGPTLPGFVCCSGCGYLVIKSQTRCPVCGVSLAPVDDFEYTTDVKGPGHATLTLPILRAAVVVTAHEQTLRGLREWLASTGDASVYVHETIDRSRSQIHAGAATVIVDVDLVDADQGAALRQLVAEAGAGTRFVVMGPPDLNWPQRVATYNLGRSIRSYLPRVSSPLDLLASVLRLRAEEA